MKIIGWLLPLLPLLAAAGCGGEKQTVRAAEIFGTRITLIVSGMTEERAAAVIGDSFAHMETMHRRFHAWREGELLRVNRAIAAAALPMTVSAPMAAMITLAADCERRAEGLFAPAAGALFSLWGAHNNPPSRPPSAEKIAAHLPPPRMQDARLSGRTLLSAAGRLDFGGIAKGAALDDIRRRLRARGVQNALLNIGGNIMAMGSNGGRPWRVRLHPADKIILLADGEAAATSGSSERFFEFGGRRHHHIIDPRTGAPSVANLAATAVSAHPRNAGAMSDAAATALMIADEEEARRIASNFALSAALQITSDGRLRPLANMQNRMQ